MKQGKQRRKKYCVTKPKRAFRWKRCYGTRAYQGARGGNGRNGAALRQSTINYYLTPEEVTAIVLHCTENQLKGYWMQCWEMVDKNVVFVSCSSVYNVIKRYNLGKKWAEARRDEKARF